MPMVAFAAAGEGAGFGMFGPPPPSLAAPNLQEAGQTAPASSPVVKTRSKFPETWLWQDSKAL